LRAVVDTLVSSAVRLGAASGRLTLETRRERRCRGDLSVFWVSTDPGQRNSAGLHGGRVPDRSVPSLSPFTGSRSRVRGPDDALVANDVDGRPAVARGASGCGIDQTYFVFSSRRCRTLLRIMIFNRSEFVTQLNTPGSNIFGPYDFNDTVVAIAIDPDLGAATDDQIGFLPACSEGFDGGIWLEDILSELPLQKYCFLPE
jgi:hypothetical protein